MRKILCLALASFMAFSVCACGSKDTVNADSSDVNETVESESEESQGQENSIETYHIGDVIESEYFTFTPEKIWMSYQLLPSKTDGTYSYYEGEEGKQWFYLTGEMKNIWNQEFVLGLNDFVTIVFDNAYTYTGHVLAEYGDLDGFERLPKLSPFETRRIFFAARVPDELLEQYSTVTIRYGYNKDFEYNSDGGEADYSFEVNADQNRDAIAAYELGVSMGLDPETASQIASGEYESYEEDSSDEGIYQKALAAKDRMYYGYAIRLMEQIPDYKDVQEQITEMKSLFAEHVGTHKVKLFAGGTATLEIDENGRGHMYIDVKDPNVFTIDVVGRIFDGDDKTSFGTVKVTNINGNYYDLDSPIEDYGDGEKYWISGDSSMWLLIADENNSYQYFDGSFTD